jgi:hypothetical protein
MYACLSSTAFCMHVCNPFLVSFPSHIAAVMATLTFADMMALSASA